MNSLTFVVALVVVLCSVVNAKSLLRRLDDCGDQDSAVGDCTAHIHVCGGWYSWEWKYTSTATDTTPNDPDNGVSADGGGHFSSSSGAGYAATYNLMNMLGLKDQETYDCNCQAQDIKQGMCNLRVAVCFYFDSTASLQNADPTYRGYVFDLSIPELCLGLQHFSCC